MAASFLSFFQLELGCSGVNSDKAATWKITNYVNNKSSERQFTPYKPRENRWKRIIFHVNCLNKSVSDCYNNNVSNCYISLQEVTIVIKTPTTVPSRNLLGR